jgi:hypothetical protein
MMPDPPETAQPMGVVVAEDEVPSSVFYVTQRDELYKNTVLDTRRINV